jgi:hypothetical protein
MSSRSRIRRRRALATDRRRRSDASRPHGRAPGSLPRSLPHSLDDVVEAGRAAGILVEFTHRFLEEFCCLDAGAARKALKTCHHVVSNDAARRARCGAHQYRLGWGGNNRPLRRAEDGATAWRAYVEIARPNARRLHWWQAPDGVFQFASITPHDAAGPFSP